MPAGTSEYLELTAGIVRVERVPLVAPPLWIGFIAAIGAGLTSFGTASVGKRNWGRVTVGRLAAAPVCTRRRASAIGPTFTKRMLSAPIHRPIDHRRMVIRLGKKYGCTAVLLRPRTPPVVPQPVATP